MLNIKPVINCKLYRDSNKEKTKQKNIKNVDIICHACNTMKNNGIIEAHQKNLDYFVKKLNIKSP